MIFLFDSGSQRGVILNHDVVSSTTPIGCQVGLTQEVHGLQWSADGVHLAGGAADGELCVWNNHSQEPMCSLNLHKSAVKVGFCLYIYLN